MANDWQMAALGGLLRRMKEEFTLQDDLTYKEVTIRLWNKGIVLRNEKQGNEIRTKRFRVRAGQLILSRIDVRNGAIGLVPPGLDGAVVSGEFWTYDVDQSQLAPKFLALYVSTPRFLDEVNQTSSGTTHRIRAEEEPFLSIRIPLPPLAEQQRIVARVDALTRRVEEARGLRRAAVEEAEKLLQSASNRVFAAEGNSTVRESVKIQSGYAFKSDWFTEDGIRLVRNVNIGHGHIEWEQIVRIPESRRPEFKTFELSEGDILVSLDRPIISTGVKVARVRTRDLPSLLLQRVGRVQFLSDRLLPDFFFLWLQSPRFSSAIDPGRSNGVPHISPFDVERIPFTLPPLPDQRHIVAYLDGLQAKVDELRRLQAATQKELDALMPSILARAFAGEL